MVERQPYISTGSVISIFLDECLALLAFKHFFALNCTYNIAIVYISESMMDRMEYWLSCLVFGLLYITLTASAACPSGCRCFTNPMTPESSQVQCDEGTQIPGGLGNVSLLNLNGNRFTNPVLSRSNFTQLRNLEELSLSGCGIATIQPNTFIGE